MIRQASALMISRPLWYASRYAILPLAKRRIIANGMFAGENATAILAVIVANVCHCANGNNTSFYTKIFQYIVQGETSVKTNSDDWSYASDCTFQIPHPYFWVRKSSCHPNVYYRNSNRIIYSQLRTRQCLLRAERAMQQLLHPSQLSALHSVLKLRTTVEAQFSRCYCFH